MLFLIFVNIEFLFWFNIVALDALTFISFDVPNSKTLVAASVSIGVVPLAANTTSNGAATSLTIVGNDTGATISITITNNVVLTGSSGAGSNF